MMRDTLRHVYWIGGGSAAGKSTIARRIAEDQGWTVYATDDVMSQHSKRVDPENSPLLQEFLAMDMNRRWVDRSPKTMLETFPWYRGEGFHLILEDLLQLPPERGVIVEGFRLLPDLVKPLLAQRGHAVWLLPTPEFRQATFERRGGTGWGFLARTGNPELALGNLLERDAMFSEHLERETRRLDLPAVEVGPTLSEEDLAAKLRQLFELP